MKDRTSFSLICLLFVLCIALAFKVGMHTAELFYGDKIKEIQKDYIEKNSEIVSSNYFLLQEIKQSLK